MFRDPAGRGVRTTVEVSDYRDPSCGLSRGEMASHDVRERDRSPMEGTPGGLDASRLAATTPLPSASDRRRGSQSSPGVRRSGRASAPGTSSPPSARRRKPARASSTYVRVDHARAPRRPAPIREPLAVGTVVRFSGDDAEARARWGPAPYYLARVHAVVRGERRDRAVQMNRRRTMKDPANAGDFADDSLAADDEKIYSLQWFVPLDALVAVCPTANAYLGEANYPLERVCDVRTEGRVELAVWRPASFDSSVAEKTDERLPDDESLRAARGEPKGRMRKQRDDDDDKNALACVAPRLYARREFAETGLEESELCHFYDDRDLDEDVGVSTRSKYVWRFVFDPKAGFAPDPKKLRKDLCCKMGSRYGDCAFNNFHVAGGGGYVMCDGCDRAHHLLCVGIDPATVPAPEGPPGVFRPNRPINEVGAVRSVRARQHFAEEETEYETDRAGFGTPEFRTDGGSTRDHNGKKRARTKLEPWFCGEACRRKYVTKQAKLMVAQKKAEAEPRAAEPRAAEPKPEPKREDGVEGDPRFKREPKEERE